MLFERKNLIVGTETASGKSLLFQLYAFTGHPAKHMTGFTGFLQADGYSGYEALFDFARVKPGPITEGACWAHCRRKFFDVWEATKSPVAKEAIDRIADLYTVETQARFAPIAERVEHRAETGPLLDRFFGWADRTLPKLSAKSALADAFRYNIKRREALTRFVTDGRLEPDNNIAENAMRGIALGRKNYLFAGSDMGSDRGASMYTIIQTAKFNDVNPEAYLRDTLAKIAEGQLRIDERSRLYQFMSRRPSNETKRERCVASVLHGRFRNAREPQEIQGIARRSPATARRPKWTAVKIGKDLN